MYVVCMYIVHTSILKDKNVKTSLRLLTCLYYYYLPCLYSVSTLHNNKKTTKLTLKPFTINLHAQKRKQNRQ